MTILVVDDLEQNRYQLQVLLGGSGYTIVTAANGAEALEKARQNPPDLIITDILMPVMDGFALCREWTRDQRLRDIPLIFYTATYTEEKDRAVALSLGAARFIIKPEDPDLFLQTIQIVIAQREHGALVIPQKPIAEEAVYLKEYNETLVRKLDDKRGKLEQANRELERELAELKRVEEALRRSEAMLNEVGRIAAIGGWEMDLVTRKAHWTKGTYDIVEIGPGDPIPGPDEHVGFYLPEYRPVVEGAMRRLIEEDIPLNFEAKLRTAKGNIKWCRALAQAERKDGVCIRVYGTFQDITERKLAEEAAHASQRQFQAIFEQAAAGVVIAEGAKGRFVKVNRRFCEIVGYSAEELLQRTSNDITHPDDLATDSARLQQIKAGTVRTSTWEKRYRRKDGTIVWVRASVSPLDPSEANPTLRIGVITDITARKRAEDALRESERQYRDLVEHANSIILHWSRDGKVIFLNEFGQKFFGFPAAEILGRHVVGTIVPPSGSARGDMRPMIDQICAHPEAFEQNVNENMRRNGERVWVAWTNRVVRDEQGQIKEILSIGSDITERKRAEEALRESQALYHSLVEQMPAGVFRKDREGRYVFVSPWFCRLKGMKKEEFLGKTPQEVAASEAAKPNAGEQAIKYAAAGADHHALVMQTGKPMEMVEEYADAAGGKQFVHVIKLPVVDAEGKVVGTQGLLFDITPRKRAEEALKESENRFRSIIESSRDGIIFFDGNTRTILFGNSAMAELLGCSAQDLVGRSIASLHPAAEWGRIEKEFQKHVSGTSAVSAGIPVVRCDGSILYADIHSRLVTVGGQSFFSAFFRDITKRKRAEEALRHEQSLFNSLISTIPDSIYFKDRQSHFVRINDSMATLFGLHNASEAVGKTDADFFTGEHAQQAYDDEQRVISTGEPMVGFVEKETWPDGRITWVSTTKVPLRDANGTITGLVGISRDITAHKEAEERAREQAALLDIASDAIYVAALDGTIRFWNKGAERIYGWSAVEALGRKTTELLAVPDGETDSAAAAVRQKGNWAGEQRHRTKMGGEVSVFARLTLVRAATGQPTSIFAIDTDITEKKQLEARFLQAQRLESLGALASGIAHDLNNVLAPVLLATAILRDRVKTDAERNMLSTMEASARRGADIVRQVLTFARGIEGKRIPLQPQHLLREIEEIASETFPKNIELISDVHKDLQPVLGDATQLHQVLMNLCVNARDAMPEGGRLTLTGENADLDEAFALMTPGATAGPHVRLSISDTGMGIPPELYEKIFNPFFTTKAPGKGTGLGLATVLGIVRSHGGFIQFKSGVGKGTCFEVYLPAVVDTRPAAKTGPRPALPRGHGELILVADDEIAIREVASRVLETWGYRVALAAEGTEALSVYMQNRPAIAAIITDMMMPGMDGPTLVRVVRKIDPQVRIMGISGVGESTTADLIDSLALSAVLTKPFTGESLLFTLHAILEAPPGTKIRHSTSPWRGASSLPWAPQPGEKNPGNPSSTA